MAQLLSASNYEEDGPEFVETKKYIEETKQKLEEGKKEMLAFIDEGKINSYIEAENADAYGVELYKQLLSEDINMSDAEKNQLEKSIRNSRRSIKLFEWKRRKMESSRRTSIIW